MNSTNGYAVIAIGYYDGESEGFARVGGTYHYFKRIELDLSDDKNIYMSLRIDFEIFCELSRLIGVDGSSGVFVYDGGNSEANRLLERIKPELEQVLALSGKRTVGESFRHSLYMAIY